MPLPKKYVAKVQDANDKAGQEWRDRIEKARAAQYEAFLNGKAASLTTDVTRDSIVLTVHADGLTTKF